MLNRGAIALSCVLAAACAAEPELGTEAQQVGGCPMLGCGENTAQVEAWDFWELDEAGQPNNAGIRLLYMRKGSNVYRPDVMGSKLYGIPYGSGLPTLTGSLLVGSQLVVRGPDGRQYYINVEKVSQDVRHWVAPFDSPPIETYELTYTNPYLGYTRPVCNNPPGRVDGEGEMWTKQLEAALYTGDRYDADLKLVTAADYAAAGTWFNIACAGSVLLKLHLNRHTLSGSTSTYQTTWQQRQAMFKMYTSDVCGTGESFTVTGTPLHWENAMNWDSLTGSESSYEAFWNENGAMCLETHRLESTFGFPGGPIDQTCAIPQCATLPFWLRGAYLLTANP